MDYDKRLTTDRMARCGAEVRLLRLDNDNRRRAREPPMRTNAGEFKKMSPMKSVLL